MSATTILTQFSQAGDMTSALRTRGRGYVHVQFRAGSAVSAPTISVFSMTMALQAKVPGSDELWCDVQTWAVAVTESMAGRDLSYLVAEPGVDVRLAVKNFQSGVCNGRVWEG